MIPVDEAFRRARARLRVPVMGPAQRMHVHLRKQLAGLPSHVVDAAIAVADESFADGAGHMQTAIDAGVRVANNLQQAAA